MYDDSVCFKCKALTDEPHEGFRFLIIGDIINEECVEAISNNCDFGSFNSEDCQNIYENISFIKKQVVLACHPYVDIIYSVDEMNGTHLFVTFEISNHFRHYDHFKRSF